MRIWRGRAIGSKRHAPLSLGREDRLRHGGKPNSHARPSTLGGQRGTALMLLMVRLLNSIVGASRVVRPAACAATRGTLLVRRLSLLWQPAAAAAPSSVSSSVSLAAVDNDMAAEHDASLRSEKRLEVQQRRFRVVSLSFSRMQRNWRVSVLPKHAAEHSSLMRSSTDLLLTRGLPQCSASPMIPGHCGGRQPVLRVVSCARAAALIHQRRRFR